MKRSIIIIFVLFLYGCVTRKGNNNIDINHIVDYYIAFYNEKSIEFNPDKTYIWLGMNRENNEYRFYISHNCLDCEGNIENHTIVKYKNYYVALYADTDENKEYLLKNFIGTNPADKFSVKPYREDIIYDIVPWRIFYNSNGKPIYFCIPNQSELEIIKRELSFSENNVEDCRK